MGSDDAGTAGSKCAGCAASRSADTSSHSTAAVRLNLSRVEATGLRCEPCGLALDTFVVSIVTWVPWNCVRVDAQLALTDSVPRSRLTTVGESVQNIHEKDITTEDNGVPVHRPMDLHGPSTSTIRPSSF